MDAELSANEVDFIYHLLEDLDALNELSLNPKQFPKEARQASAIARRLILESDLKRAASLVRDRIKLVRSPMLSSKREYADKGIVLAHSGLSRFRSQPYWGFSCDYTTLYLDVREDAEFSYCSLDEFIAQKVVYYHGEFVSRGDMIRFAANAMGGVHHGSKKIASHELIEKAKGAITFELVASGKYSIAIEVTRLCNLHNDVFPDRNSLNLVHLEILSIARLISTAPFVEALIKHLNQLILR